MDINVCKDIEFLGFLDQIE